MSEKSELSRMLQMFSGKMRQTLYAKVEAGWIGWDRPHYRKQFEKALIAHALRAVHGERGQWVDVANFAAFLDAIESGPTAAKGDRDERR